MDDAAKIAEEIVEVMRADKGTSFKVCSGYVLSSVRRYLRGRHFHVEEVEITGELQEMVERGYIRWCVDVGVPAERLGDKGVRAARAQRRFWPLLKWVAEKPKLREKLVKTGWKSWRQKWRKKVLRTEELEI